MIETVKKPRKILMVIVIGSILAPPALEVRAGLQWPTCVNDVSVADVEFQETYGVVPEHWRQVVPAAGAPPPLEFGRRYSLSVGTRWGVKMLGTSFIAGLQPDRRCTGG